MNWRSVPDHQQLALGFTPHMLEKDHPLKAGQRRVAHQGIKFTSHRHAAHDRQVIVGLKRTQDRRFSSRGIGPDQPGQQIKPRFVDKHDQTAFCERPFFSSGQTSTREWRLHHVGWLAQAASGASSPRPSTSARHVALWYTTPNSSLITEAHGRRSRVRHEICMPPHRGIKPQGAIATL